MVEPNVIQLGSKLIRKPGEPCIRWDIIRSTFERGACASGAQYKYRDYASVRRWCGLFSNYFGHLLQFWMCQWDVNITCIFAGLQNLSAYNAFTLFQLHICQVCGSFQCPYCDYYNAAPPGAMTSPGWMLCSLLLLWLVNAVNMTTSISLCVKWWFQQFCCMCQCSASCGTRSTKNS